jgi:hypothetical protein
MSDQVVRPGEPSWVVYAVAAAVAAPAGCLLPLIWTPGPTLLGGGLAVGAAIFGVFLREGVGEAIVISLISGGLFALVPKVFFVTCICLPLAAGHIIGRLTVGL